MENRINLTPSTNAYLQQFFIAQANLSNLIREERMLKRLQKSKRQLLKPQ